MSLLLTRHHAGYEDLDVARKTMTEISGCLGACVRQQGATRV